MAASLADVFHVNEPDTRLPTAPPAASYPAVGEVLWKERMLYVADRLSAEPMR